MFRLIDPNPDFNKLEEELLSYWEENQIFDKSLKRTKDGEPFTFYDGPPFATGLPHYGHILASTVKDLVPRYQTMRGRYVRRRWGWDCHGLPIEELVEKELKISGKKDIEEKVGIEKFNATCRKFVLRYAEEWGKMVRRIARWIEFDNSYKTMDTDYMESVWWAFKQIHDKGLVYEGRKVLLYCPRCETPISNFEVAMDNSYRTITDKSVIVKFRIKTEEPKNQKTKEQFFSPSVLQSLGSPAYLLAWTTTPWTLPGNLALAVADDIDYALIRAGDEHYVLARDRVKKIFDTTEYETVKVMKGKELEGLSYKPLYDIDEMRSERSYRVYTVDFVSTDEGTGIVHTAVVYGEDDYALGQSVGLPVVPLLDEKGIFNQQAPDLVQGQNFKESETDIIKDLEKRELLLSQEDYSHSYPHCWRCESPLFYNAIPAWFINIQRIKDKILSSNEREINWYPEHLKHGRYENSVDAAPDWNISRNRYWGNPMPVWVCSACEKRTVIGSISELAEKSTNLKEVYPNWKSETRNSKSESNTKYNILNTIYDGIDLHRPYIDKVILKCSECSGQAFRIPDIFDSWVEASAMPFAEFHYPFENKEYFPDAGSTGSGSRPQASGESRFPAQFVAEYIAQTRAWFYTMHVLNFILFDQAPFEHVVTTGTILAEDGSKMSKSKQNFPDPWKVIEEYGVDSLRFYLMSSVVMRADNLNFSEKELGVTSRKVFRILWNVLNYYVTYSVVSRQHTVDSSDTEFTDSRASTSRPLRPGDGARGEAGGLRSPVYETLDEWMRVRTQELVNQTSNYLNNYDTVRATREMEDYISDLSTWYIRRSRGRDDQAFFDCLHEALIICAKVVAPVMPYIAEKIYLTITDKESVHLESWPESRDLSADQQKLLTDMRNLREIAEKVHALRAEAGVKLRQPLAKLIVPASQLKNLRTQELKNSSSVPKSFGSLVEILKDEVNVKAIVDGEELTLDTTITAELKIEGQAAEIQRLVNNFRKDSGLKIGETAELYYESNSADIKKAFDLVEADKIYAGKIEEGRPEQADYKTEIEIDEEKVRLSLKVVR